MERRDLSGPWTLRLSSNAAEAPAGLRGRAVAAAVPGCVHTDLMAAGLIPDPYLGFNENLVQWVGRADWLYETTFEADAALLSETVRELVFEGLDTMAEIRLNGEAIGRTNSMHVPWRFDVTGKLRPGTNALSILFSSAEAAALAEAARLGDLPRVRPLPYNFIRKMACNFSWDWGPTLVTAGLWRPARVEGWSTVRIESVRPLVMEAEAWRARIALFVGLQRAAEGNAGSVHLKALLVGPEGETAAEWSADIGGDRAAGRIEIPNPRLWWPRSHGDQPLYRLELALFDREGRCLDEWQGRIGLRTVRLDTSPDAVGSAFTFRVNGQPIFMRGANWIPDDCFPTRVTRKRYGERLSQAVAANTNMLRVWGGGIYESHDFYDLCDELGLLVWQDFLFACAAYPEEAPFPALVEAEARHQMARLSRHPSLALWCGNNENLWLFFERQVEEGGRTWADAVGERPWGTGYYLDLLPRLAAELDPSRPYTAGTPWSGTFDRHANDDRHGPTHTWDAWNTDDYTVHRRYRPRFVTEYGHEGPATFATLARALPREELRPGSRGMVHRQRATNGEAKLRARLAEHFRVPENFDDWHYLTQLNQARAIRLAAEWHRASKPRTMGTLYWQLNDCWPVTSWAAIDGDGRPKPLWFETRRIFADRLLTIQPEDETVPGRLLLHADNETGVPWRGDARLRRLGFDGTVLEEQALAFEVPARGQAALPLPKILTRPSDPLRELLVAEANVGRALWFYRRDLELAYPEPRFAVAIEWSGAAHHVTVTAATLIRDLAIFPDRLDSGAEIDDQLVTLLAGDSVAFTVRIGEGIDPHLLAERPVLQCANWYGARDSTK